VSANDNGHPEAPGLPALAAVLGHEFTNLRLLEEAVTHPSVAGLSRAPQGSAPAPGSAYERLEFLGDRVLGLLVAEWLLERLPEEREGGLARRHAALVRREAVAQVAGSIGLGDHLRLAPGEQASGGRHNLTILGDAGEAVIGALYLDGGLEPARRFVRRHWTALLEESGPARRDAKTELQEWVQGRGLPLPHYAIVQRSGPAHAPEFEVAVMVEGWLPAHASGRSRRSAETAAAAALLARIEAEPHD
jgi:ribonuclease-3